MIRKKHRVALIGVTGYAAHHLEALLSPEVADLAKLSAAVVINPEEAHKACAQLKSVDCSIYPNVETMWSEHAGKIDLCVILTSIASHCSLTIQALERGANVLVEKPLAGTICEVDKMLDAEKSSQRCVATGFQDIYQPCTQRLKQCLLAGEIGKLSRIKVKCLWPRSLSYYQRNAWAGRIKFNDAWIFDSPVNNAMAHFVNLALYFAGQSKDKAPTLTELKAELYRAQPIESFDTVCFKAKTANGIEILFWGSHSGEGEINPVIVIEGESGVARWTCHNGVSIESHVNGVQFFPNESLSPMQVMYRSVLNRLAGKPDIVCTIAMARTHTHLVNRLHQEFPIKTIPAAFLKQLAIKGNPGIAVSSMENQISSCFETNQLFSQAGIPWAIDSSMRSA